MEFRKITQNIYIRFRSLVLATRSTLVSIHLDHLRHALPIVVVAVPREHRPTVVAHALCECSFLPYPRQWLIDVVYFLGLLLVLTITPFSYCLW
jgi:hypothetical protein